MFAVSLQFPMQSNETTTSAMGEEGEKEKAAEEESSGWCTEEKYIHNSLYSSKGTKNILMNTELWLLWNL